MGGERPLGLEHRAPPGGEPARRIDGWLGDAELQIAYPGIWLRDDVYATHGHYMDCHMSLPRAECLAAAAVMRAFGPVPTGATRRLRAGAAARSTASPSASRRRDWRAARPGPPSGPGGRSPAATSGGRPAVRAAGGRRAGVPASVWTINRLLRADFDADLSAGAISRSGIDAATEMARRLRIGAAHVITGHTHRGRPGRGRGRWELPGGGQLHNTGSWVFASAFHHPGTPPGPYWPGTVTWVEDEGPPRRARLLLERSREELRAVVSRQPRAGD